MSTCGDPGREWATAGSRDPFSMAAGLVQGRLQQFAELLLMEEQQLDWIVANLSLAGGAVES